MLQVGVTVETTIVRLMTLLVCIILLKRPHFRSSEYPCLNSNGGRDLWLPPGQVFRYGS